MPMLKNGLETMLSDCLSEDGLKLPEWPIPPSPLFDQNASKIGLLDAQTARDVAYVYENLRAFRQNFHMLSKHHRDMPKDWSHAMIVGCLAAISRAETRGMPLIESLKRQTTESYWNRPQTRIQLKYGAVTIFAFLGVLKVLGW
jgi:hypothetical protein